MILNAQELGRLNLTYQNQTAKSIFEDYKTLSSFHAFYLDFQQSFLQLGSVSFSISGSIYENKKELSFYSFRVQDIPVGKFKITAGFGYTSYKISSLLPFGSFNPSRHVSIKGGSFSLESEKISIILFGGRFYGIAGAKERKSSIYGFKGIFNLIKDWTLGIGYIKGKNLPQNNKTIDSEIFTIDSSLRIRGEFYLLGDFKYSLTSKDYSLKIGPYFRSKRLSLQFYYNYATPYFPQIERIQIRDRKGYLFIGTLQPFRVLSLFTSVNTYDENLERILERPVNDYLTYSYGANISLPIFPSISFRINRSERESEKGGLKISDSCYNSFYLSLFKNYKRFYFNFRFNRGNFKNFIDPTQDFLNLDYVFELRKLFLNGSLFYLNFYFTQRESRWEIFKKENYSLQAGVTLKPSYNLMINSQFNYSFGKDKITGQKNRGMGGSAGIWYNFQPLKLNFSFQYRFSLIESIFSYTARRYYHQIVFRITKSFTWGRKRKLSYAKNIADIFRGTGEIEGVVFVDLNSNNIKDRGEETFSDIEIMLDGRVVTKTDENGHYKISSVIPGEHKISLLLRKIPAYYQPISEEKKIGVKGKKKYQLDFILVPLGIISGKVILDLNENGVGEEKEPPLKEIHINLIKDDEIVSDVFTDSKGIFKFDNIMPGKYKVEIDSIGIEGKYRKNEKSLCEIDLKAGEELRDIILLLNKYKKPKVKKIFDYFYGKISGKVVLDFNGNGEIDDNDKGVSGIKVELLPIRKELKTDENGYYSFENIPAGEYTLRIDLKSLPPEASFISKSSKKINVFPSQILENQNFLISIRKEK